MSVSKTIIDSFKFFGRLRCETKTLQLPQSQSSIEWATNIIQKMSNHFDIVYFYEQPTIISLKFFSKLEMC